MRLPLGGSSKDFDSKKSHQTVVNLLMEADAHGEYRTARRIPGETQVATGLDGTVRSNILYSPETGLSRIGISGGPWTQVLYFVAGSVFYEWSNDIGTGFNAIGTIGGTGPCQVSLNNDQEVLVSNGSGSVYLYDTTGTLTLTSTATNFLTPAVDITTLNDRFLLVNKGSNIFFASDNADGSTYSSLSRGEAEEHPDPLIAMRAIKSYAWAIGSNTCELWQTFDDVDLPLRPVTGATIMRGTQSYASVANLEENIAFLADDGTVRLLAGSESVHISDLELELLIKGNGTDRYPGFSEPTDCYGFFIDDPIHPTYVLSWVTDNYTWVYDLSTRLSHQRQSLGNYYKLRGSARINGKIICGDNTDSKLWELDPQVFKEGTDKQTVLLRSPPLSFEEDMFIPLIEIDMEVGRITTSDDARLNVRYSKDGGITWIQHSDISFGKVGQYHKRVPLRRFGRLVRGKEFVLELSTSANTHVAFYGAWWTPERSI